MRTVILISVAVLALSSAAQAGNTQTTVQVDIINNANTTQNGPGNNGSGMTQNSCSGSFQRNSPAVGQLSIFGANASSV